MQHLTHLPWKELPRRYGAGALGLLIMGSLLAFTVLPLIFMVTASVMPSGEIMRMPYPWIPSELAFRNYYRALAGHDESFIFVRNIMNSLIVSSSVTVTTVILGALTGYSLAKFQYKGRIVIFMMIMATMMIPFETIMIPLYMVATKLGMQNSYAGLILPFMLNAFGVFMMRQYYSTFPGEFLDAARVDGMGEISIFGKIILPNTGPAIATLAILAFRSQWDTLLWPLLIAQSHEMKTIPVYIVQFAAERTADYGAMMAVATIASVPMFVLFIALSRYFTGGAAVFSARKG
ncbi:ABC transporter permease [Alkalispirochaeta sphaeroplastigenens]|uniref:sn-glycerol-3-phosphate transport system permease protein UgpE n=1 Tax=Alkalispirochaeta sphaeroplastigenens TaxID=1187066 RepID=A0A2S4JJJ2_9SPIO|nr:ABC transporter permease [Alkalispirochaeta sphaeroplastigenens]